MTTHIFQVCIHIDLIICLSVIRKRYRHITFPRNVTAQLFVNRLRQNTHFCWLPVAQQIDANLVIFLTSFGIKINTYWLVKPGGFQRFAFQIAVHKAEFTRQVAQRAGERFYQQRIVVKLDVT